MKTKDAILVGGGIAAILGVVGAAAYLLTRDEKQKATEVPPVVVPIPPVIPPTPPPTPPVLPTGLEFQEAKEYLNQAGSAFGEANTYIAKITSFSSEHKRIAKDALGNAWDAVDNARGAIDSVNKYGHTPELRATAKQVVKNTADIVKIDYDTYSAIVPKYESKANYAEIVKIRDLMGQAYVAASNASGKME